jgi:hypothetical protein
MRGLVASAVIVLALVAGAATADPGPNGNNNHGLCTAYFNGSQNGRDNKHRAGPFAALEAAANARDGEDNDGDGEVDEADEVARAVWDWCNDPENNEKGVGGQPEDPSNEDPEGNGKDGRGHG